MGIPHLEKATGDLSPAFTDLILQAPEGTHVNLCSLGAEG